MFYKSNLCLISILSLDEFWAFLGIFSVNFFAVFLESGPDGTKSIKHCNDMLIICRACFMINEPQNRPRSPLKLPKVL